MNPLDSAACGQYGLPDKDTSWCGAMVDIPASAAVVDFVISDRWEADTALPVCQWLVTARAAGHLTSLRQEVL